MLGVLSYRARPYLFPGTESLLHLTLRLLLLVPVFILCHTILAEAQIGIFTLIGQVLVDSIVFVKHHIYIID